jgi:hypothetical protein
MWETADLLIAAGKNHWVKPQRRIVEAGQGGWTVGRYCEAVMGALLFRLMRAALVTTITSAFAAANVDGCTNGEMTGAETDV